MTEYEFMNKKVQIRIYLNFKICSKVMGTKLKTCFFRVYSSMLSRKKICTYLHLHIDPSYNNHNVRNWAVLTKLCSKHVQKELDKTNGHISISMESTPAMGQLHKNWRFFGAYLPKFKNIRHGKLIDFCNSTIITLWKFYR